MSLFTPPDEYGWHPPVLRELFTKRPSWRQARERLAPDRAIEGTPPMHPKHVVAGTRFEVLERTDGKWVLIDPERPWNDAGVFVGPTLEACELRAKTPGPTVVGDCR
jgi:hypothetical protein